jgi:hypothetical protein
MLKNHLQSNLLILILISITKHIYLLNDINITYYNCFKLIENNKCMNYPANTVSVVNALQN